MDTTPYRFGQVLHSEFAAKLSLSADALKADIDAQDILALNLTRAIQLCVDMGSHWIAEHHEITSPTTMGQSFEVLAERGVIARDLAEDMRKSVGFRNIVVHNYEDVDWQIVFAICHQHRDEVTHDKASRFDEEDPQPLIRQYLPKGTDLSEHSREALDAIALELNIRPRKRFDFKCPIEMMQEMMVKHRNASGSLH